MSIDFVKARDIFTAAVEKVDPVEQRDYLDEVCGVDSEMRRHVERLLGAHEQSASFLDQGAVTTLAAEHPLSEAPGTTVGPYKLIEQIGEGGFGVVFLAEQATPIRRRVALKIVKPGMDTRQVIARFEAERQALALMDHPNIAKVHDAGTTESGRPYFVMELIAGVPITKFCDEHHLSLRKRLELFKPVCEAVQHAHQKGIIHRDIKPTNVLVAESDNQPIPKVIDFGVAKATAPRLTERTMFTEFGQMIGTVEYMSPEQAKLNQLDIDTRSDVYSLGVLLYELLTGSTPFGKERLQESAFDEMLRIIREEEPPKPSTRLSSTDGLPSIAANRSLEPLKLNRAVEGDLDWIVMKALEKDRDRRYDTANGLAADVQRFLHDEAVMASPPSASYRLRKLACRHRAAIMTALLVCATLMLGTVVSVWQTIRATQAAQLAESSRLAEAAQRAEAERHRQQAEANERIARLESAKSRQVADFLKEMFGGPTPWVARGRDTEVLREIIDRAAARIETDLTDQPEVEAELRSIMGSSYWSVADLQKSEAMYRRALDLYRRLKGSAHPLVAESLVGLAIALRDRSKRSEAESALREALEIQRKAIGEESLEVAHTLRDLGMVLPKDKREEAESLERQSLSIRRKLHAADHWEVADSLNRLAGVLDESNLVEGEVLLREAIAMSRRLSPMSPDTGLAGTLYSLAINLQHQGRLPEAEAAARESLSAMSEATGAGSSWTVSPFYRLMVILDMEGKTTDLEQLFLDYPIPNSGRPGYRADMLHCRAKLFSHKGAFAEAENFYREALAIRKQTFGNENSITIENLDLLIDVLERGGKQIEAENLRRESGDVIPNAQPTELP